MVDCVVVYCYVFDGEYWKLFLFVVIVGVVVVWFFECVFVCGCCVVGWVWWCVGWSGGRGVVLWMNEVFEYDFCVCGYL